ncbi:MAG: beta-galactosidase [Armatimonadota bacterium]
MALNLQDNMLVVNGTPLPFFCGEIHYWRNDPSTWREALIMAKLAGLNFVSTYFPWDVHEVDEGYTDLGSPLSYDFTGRTDPRKNLLGFLELAQQEGLYVVARPGPQIVAEWKHKGPPLHSFAFDWPEPGYKTALARWFDAVSKVIARYSVDNGGPIVLCQVDNEGHELTVEGARMYFEHKFGDAPTFNSRFWTSYPDLATAAKDLCVTMPHNILQHYVDAFNTDNPHLKSEKKLAKLWFQVQLIADYAAMLRARGVTLPLFLNSNGTPDSHDYLGTQQHLDFMGLNLAMSYMIPLPHYGLLENSCKYVSSTSRWPVMNEQSTGAYARGWVTKLGPMDGEHLQRFSVIEAANGIKGITYYMFMDRDMTGRSPLSETGKPSDAYFGVFHQQRALLRAGFPATKPQAKVALCWHHALAGGMHATIPNLDWVEVRAYKPDDNPLNGYPGLFYALLGRDADFAVADINHADVLHGYELLLIPGCAEMDAEEYARIQAYGDRVCWVGEAPARAIGGDPLPACAGQVVHSLEEIDPALLYVIRTAAPEKQGQVSFSGTASENVPVPAFPGVRSYLHLLGEDRVIYLLNLDDKEKMVSLQGIDLSGDVVDCWHATNLGPAEGQTYRLPAWGWRILRITSTPEALTGVTRVEREYF